MSKDYVITRIDMEFVGSQFPTPQGGTITVTGVHGVDKNRTKIFTSTCSICSKDKELYSDEFTCLKDHLLKGSVPCGCSKNPTLNESQRIIIINRILSKEKYSFNQFISGYKNKHSKFSYNCPEHGKQTTTYHNFSNGRRCLECSKEIKRITNAEDIMISSCRSQGLNFVGFESDYKNIKSKVIYNCPYHGNHSTEFRILKSGHGCPSCQCNGFDVNKPAFLYLVRWKTKSGKAWLKYGITNNQVELRIKRQLQTHESETGEFLQYEILHIKKGLGSHIKSIESSIKHSFPHSGISKSEMWDGYTETLPIESYHDVIKLIKGKD
ncbi:putative endonuclease [Aeromonas phage avDM6]|nr:putative endonuclease [Aeromonas phage avDM6]